MEIAQAMNILGVSAADDVRAIKVKFRKLIGQYHPDAIGSDLPEHNRRAQEINEAYSILKKAGLSRIRKEEKTSVWQGEHNRDLFAARNVYMAYEVDGDILYRTVANGKYMWDPDEEEFSLFLKSVNHVCQELLSEWMDKYECLSEEISEEIRFAHHAALFRHISEQFVNPLKCLRKIAEPDEIDEKGRQVYRFRAFLGSQGASAQFRIMETLRPGDRIYPDMIRNNRIMVSDGRRNPLGHLSLEEDELYYCLLPLLRRREAQVKLTVQQVDVNRRRRPMRVKANVELLFRVEADAGTGHVISDEKIRSVLHKWETYLQSL